MSKQPAYWELLRRPEWQRKRLEIMQRDGFRCTNCADSETTLNVHHTYYTKGAMPWEYPSESLRTLCEHCHEAISHGLSQLRASAGRLGPSQLETLIGFAIGVERAEAAGRDTEHYDGSRVPLPTGGDYEKFIGIVSAIMADWVLYPVVAAAANSVLRRAADDGAAEVPVSAVVNQLCWLLSKMDFAEVFRDA